MTKDGLIEDKKHMDEISDKLKDRQDIWQDRFIYWIAVALGNLLEWEVGRKLK